MNPSPLSGSGRHHMTDLEREPASAPAAFTRRRFMGFVIGGATLAVAADLGLASTAYGAVPSLPQVPEYYDLGDLQTQAALPTSALITILLHPDGTASFDIPRMEVGQGITTSTAMIIAEELDLPVEKVHVGLAPARPELLWNQLTGGSNTTESTFTPIRVAAAVARKRLLEAAALQLGYAVNFLTTRAGRVFSPDGSSLGYGDLAAAASSPTTQAVEVELKATKGYRV